VHELNLVYAPQLILSCTNPIVTINIETLQFTDQHNHL